MHQASQRIVNLRTNDAPPAHAVPLCPGLFSLYAYRLISIYALQVNALQSELDRAKQQVAEATAALQQQQQQTQELQQQQQQQADHQLQQQQFSLQHAVSSAVSTPVVPSPAAVASQHKLEASLGDWQQQLQARLHRHSGMPSQADSKELQQMHLGDRRGSSGLQSNGSGLFELLPMGQAVPATAGSAAAAAVQAATAGSFAAQQRHGHSRTASSGGISFDPEMVAAASGQAAAAADDAADSQPEGVQPASQPALPDSTASAPLGIAATAEPAVQPVQQAAGLARRGSDSGSLSVLRSSPGSSAAASPAAAGTLSSSPVMSWSGGMMTAGSSSGMRPRHTTPAPSQHATSSSSSGASSGKAATAVLARPAATAGVTPGLLLPGPLHCNVAVQHTQHQQQAAAAGSRGGVSCVAFSPTGANVASACSQGVVAIWSPPGVLGNANRHASVACGCPVSCVAWDARADKLMLIGCSGAGGVRAWHADTRRVMQDVAPEPGFPAVVAVAACPSEPTFVVAANNRPLPPATEPGDRAVTSSTAQPASGMGSLPLVGRLSCFNGRSFKRSAVLALPYEVGLASLAYSSNGSQLLVGTTAGSVLLYEPSSRSSPLRVWQVAAATLPGSNSSETLLPVQVVWQPGVTSGGSGTSTTSSVQGTAAAAAGSGSFFSMCAGMLCEWAVAGFSSRTPLAAVDVVAAAASSLASQQPANRSSASSSRSKADSAESSQQGPGALHDEKAPTHGSSHVGTDRQEWVCQCAVSPDGCQVVVIAGRLDAGVLLLYGAGSKDGSAENSSSSSGNAQWAVQPQVLLQGDVLAGGGCVAWHPALPVLVVGCAGSNASLAVTLS